MPSLESTAGSRGTLIRPPPEDPRKSRIENLLELTTLKELGPDIFTNTRPLWHPPGARGIFGGCAIAQSLAAAQLTVPRTTSVTTAAAASSQPPSKSSTSPSPPFFVHSMHCYFVLAGEPDVPVVYHVERVREGSSFLTRTVQARQRGRCIFTTTLSFVREGSAGPETLEHAIGLPEDALATAPRDALADNVSKAKAGKEDQWWREEAERTSSPMLAKRLEIKNSSSPNPSTKKTRSWFRARGRLSATGGPQAHLIALAYMSDSYFIGHVALVHEIPPYSSNYPKIKSQVEESRPSAAVASSSSSSSSSLSSTSSLDRPSSASSDAALSPSSSPSSVPQPPLRAQETAPKKPRQSQLQSQAPSPSSDPCRSTSSRQMGMMVSLDHTIFFHRPRELRADEWMFAEMESPWSGSGRGLVLQRIWDRRGRLLATCVQEGVVRLKQQANPIKGDGRKEREEAKSKL